MEKLERIDDRVVVLGEIEKKIEKRLREIGCSLDSKKLHVYHHQNWWSNIAQFLFLFFFERSIPMVIIMCVYCNIIGSSLTL